VLRLVPGPAVELTSEGLAEAYAYPGGEGAERSWVRANMIASIDGAAAAAGRSGPLSGPADRALFSLLRTLADVVLVGAGTVRAERYGPVRRRPELAGLRAAAGQPPAAVLAIVSNRLDLDEGSVLFTESDPRPVVLTSEVAPAARREALEPVADVVVAGAASVDLGRALDALAARGLHRVLCEGGPTLLGAVTTANRIDELCVTVSPLMVGGVAPRLLSGTAERRWTLRLAHLLEQDGFLFARYLADRPPPTPE